MLWQENVSTMLWQSSPKASRNPLIAKDTVVTSDTPKYFRVQYDHVAELEGQPIRQKHVNYFITFGGKWIDVHISIVEPTDEDEKVFDTFDKSLSYGYIRQGVFKEGSEPDGFRGMAWGTDKQVFSGLVHVRTDPIYGGVEIYKKQGDELRTAQTDLVAIEYGFWKGKLIFVHIFYEGFEKFNNLKKTTFEKFGIGRQVKGGSETYVWYGSRTRMTLQYTDFLNFGSLILMSIQLYKDAEQHDRQ